MRPCLKKSGIHEVRFPRVSGDAPAANMGVPGAKRFSPRERGCAFSGLEIIHERCVFPA